MVVQVWVCSAVQKPLLLSQDLLVWLAFLLLANTCFVHMSMLAHVPPPVSHDKLQGMILRLWACGLSHSLDAQGEHMHVEVWPVELAGS